MSENMDTTAVSSPTRHSSPQHENQQPSNLEDSGPPTSTTEDDSQEKRPFPGQASGIPHSEHDAVSEGQDAAKDLDELLADLESDDEGEKPNEDVIPEVGAPRYIPDVMLQTPPNRGLDDWEVIVRRKRFGWNQMKEENRSHIKQFIMFFVGPIQTVMEVSGSPKSCCEPHG